LHSALWGRCVNAVGSYIAPWARPVRTVRTLGSFLYLEAGFAIFFLILILVIVKCISICSCSWAWGDPRCWNSILYLKSTIFPTEFASPHNTSFTNSCNLWSKCRTALTEFVLSQKLFCSQVILLTSSYVNFSPCCFPII